MANIPLLREMLSDILERMMGEDDTKYVKHPTQSPSTADVSQRGGRAYNPQTGRAEYVPKKVTVTNPRGQYSVATFTGNRAKDKVIQRGIDAYQRKIPEATELRGLVAKVGNEAKADQVVQFLNGHQIDARAADEAQFDPHNETEAKGWGVFVEPGEVKAAAKVLQHQAIAKGITFDPYTHTAGKRF